jgi:hypothetical protein
VRHFGERDVPIVTHLRVKVFALGNKSCTLRLLKPNPGKGWDAAGVEAILEEIAADLRLRFPAYEYKRVQVSPLAFNFVFIGTRTVPTERLNDGASDVGVQNSEQSKT